MQTNLTVYTVPLGATMRESFCKELKALDYGKGVLLLPTGLLQKRVKESFNIAVSGFDTLANKILNLNGYAYLEEINYRSQQLVVQEVLAYYSEQGQFSYLASLKDKKGFVKHMTALISQLSRSGATAEEITSALTSWGRAGSLGSKDREVALVYQGYRNLLKAQSRFDLEGKYRLALKILREQKKPRLPWQVVYLSDFATLDALQLELLLALAKHCEVKVGLCYEKDRSYSQISQTTLEALEKTVQAQSAAGSAPLRAPALEHISALLGAQGLHKIARDSSIVVREYKHQLAEIKGVLTEIKAELLAGAKLEDYAVAVYDLNNYKGLRLIADAYGIPLTLPKKEQLLVQPLTEFLLQLLAAVPDNRQGVESYFALLGSSIGKLFFGISLEGMAKLKEKVFFKQRSSVQAAVAAELEGQEKPAFLEKIDDFLAHCQQRDTITGFVEILTNFVTELSLAKELGRLYKEEKIGLTGLQSILSTERLLLDSLSSLQEDYEKCGLAGDSYSLQDFISAWQEGLAEQSLTLSIGRKDGLLVTNAVQLQGASFKRVYLLGLREGEFPAGNRENWLYNDKERGELQAMGIELPNTFNAYAADYCLFAGAAAAATERLVLSYYKDDEGEESPYLDEVQKLFLDLEVDVIEAKAPASRAEAIESSSSCDREWLEQQVGQLSLKAASIDVNRNGKFNGTLEEQALLDSLEEQGRAGFSASSLGSYVDCPFKYLGMRLWKQQDRGEKSEQLDGGTRGSLFHDTAAAFVKTYLKNKPPKDMELLWTRLMAIYQEKVAQYEAEGKILANEFWSVESKELERLLGWWLRYEVAEQEQWDDFCPVALERGFGSQGLPVCLETVAGQPVYLIGRVDRIDADSSCAFITDYKSGNAPGNNDFVAGKDLQMAFYLLAAEKLCPDKEILGGNYLSLKEKKRLSGVAWKDTRNAKIKTTGTKKNPTYASWDEVKAACEAMVIKPATELYKGKFQVEPRYEKVCRFCPLKDICRLQVLQQSVQGKESNQNGEATANCSTAGDN